MRAAFMERTKVKIISVLLETLGILHGLCLNVYTYFQAKDLIQRLYMRLYYVTSHRRGKVQTSILSYKNNQMDVDKEENR